MEYNREKIKKISPREFVFFVADIFEKLGFSVKITQATRDGGKDIIATKAVPYHIR
ncbi:restriction endonuclease [Enterococcus cecorum]|uniref:restriction endonuclease n=1 Tax=Enterococcus cecorum TaxID=44008 RepID=UPI002ACAF34C|nr:restriction endonuclease [Enterococcus cecorum]MDZ5585149.1 restriction endonuclease [Enterococcus cecorum]